jgi:hypothetical protein
MNRIIRRIGRAIDAIRVNTPERVWWAVRTTYMDTDELAARLAELRANFPA